MKNESYGNVLPHCCVCSLLLLLLCVCCCFLQLIGSKQTFCLYLRVCVFCACLCVTYPVCCLSVPVCAACGCCLWWVWCDAVCCCCFLVFIETSVNCFSFCSLSLVPSPSLYVLCFAACACCCNTTVVRSCRQWFFDFWGLRVCGAPVPAGLLGMPPVCVRVCTVCQKGTGKGNNFHTFTLCV